MLANHVYLAKVLNTLEVTILFLLYLLREIFLSDKNAIPVHKTNQTFMGQAIHGYLHMNKQNAEFQPQISPYKNWSLGAWSGTATPTASSLVHNGQMMRCCPGLRQSALTRLIPTIKRERNTDKALQVEIRQVWWNNTIWCKKANKPRQQKQSSSKPESGKGQHLSQQTTQWKESRRSHKHRAYQVSYSLNSKLYHPLILPALSL